MTRRRAGLLAGLLVTAALAAGCVAPGTFGERETPVPEAPRAEGPDVGPFTAYVVAQVAGYEMMGLPVLPLTTDADGTLTGRTDPPDPGMVRSVPEWFRFCGKEESPATDPEADRDNRLHYAVPEGDFDEPPWWTERAGEPVRAEDLAPGEHALATWRSEGLPAIERIHVWVVRLDEGALSPVTKHLAHDGVVAFSAQTRNFCSIVDFAGELERPYPAQWAPGLEDDPLLVVDSVAESAAWNPRWVVRDILVDHSRGLEYTTHWGHYDRQTGCERLFALGFRQDEYEVSPGGTLRTTYRLGTEDAAFRNLTWEAYLSGEEDGGPERVATFRLEGPDRVGPNETVTLPVEFRVPENLTGEWRLGVVWQGEALDCEGEWVRMRPEWIPDSITHLRVGEEASAGSSEG